MLGVNSRKLDAYRCTLFGLEVGGWGLTAERFFAFYYCLLAYCLFPYCLLPPCLLPPSLLPLSLLPIASLPIASFPIASLPIASNSSNPLLFIHLLKQPALIDEGIECSVFYNLSLLHDVNVIS